MTQQVRNLELHEAMVLVLLERKLESGEPAMTTTDLASMIRSRSLYLQKEGGHAEASQIGSRATRYPALFAAQDRGGTKHIVLRELPRA